MIVQYLWTRYCKSSEVGQAAFNTQWYKLSIAIHKSLQIIMQKAQKPIVVAIPCLMPSLSLNYYASVRKNLEYYSHINHHAYYLDGLLFIIVVYYFWQ